MVSVIIPVFNASAWLEKTIESVLKQDFLTEIICVDDHSADNSWRILKSYERKFPGLVKVFKNPLKGGNNARNFGFLQSSGRFIQWLDADDQLLEGKFKAQVGFLLENPGCDVVYSDWYMDFYENGRLKERREIRKAQYRNFTYEILSDNWSPPANYLLRREIAEKLHRIKGWNPATPVAQDREYFTKAALSNTKFCYVPGFFSIYNRWSGGQVSAVDFKERLKHQLVLEERFRKIILNGNFPLRERVKYSALLNAHIINACYYHPQLTIRRPFAPLINVKIIRWKKYPFVPFIYIWQHFKFCVKKFFSWLKKRK